MNKVMLLLHYYCKGTLFYQKIVWVDVSNTNALAWLAELLSKGTTPDKFLRGTEEYPTEGPVFQNTKHALRLVYGDVHVQGVQDMTIQVMQVLPWTLPVHSRPWGS